MFQVSGSTSTKTGVAPTYLIGLTVATKVITGTITSSPGPIPSSYNARCNAAVPLCVETALLAFRYWANLFSNISMFSPTEETKVESIHSTKYFFSNSPKFGASSKIPFTDNTSIIHYIYQFCNTVNYLLSNQLFLLNLPLTCILVPNQLLFLLFLHLIVIFLLLIFLV